MFKWLKRALRRSPKQEDVYLPDTWKWTDRRLTTTQHKINSPFLSPRAKLPLPDPYYTHDEYDGFAEALKELNCADLSYANLRLSGLLQDQPSRQKP